MTNNVHVLPIWKKDSTPAEWFQELAMMALEHPERFARCAIVYEEINETGGAIKTRCQSRGIATNTDLIGSLESAKMDVWAYMNGLIDS